MSTSTHCPQPASRDLLPHKRRRHAGCLAALACLGIGVAMPASANIMSKSDFHVALNGALGDRQMRNQTTAGETLTLEELNGIGTQGGWRVFVTNSCLLPGAEYRTSNNFGKMMRFRLPSVFANQGTHFEFVMNSQTVQPHQRERVEKKLAERLDTLRREYADLEGAIERQADGSYQMQARQKYGSNPSPTATRERLAATVSNARFMICDIYNETEMADADQWKALRGSKLGKLERGQLIALYPLLKESGYEVQGTLPGGQWAFKLSKDLTARVENHGTELKVWVYAKPSAAPTPAKNQTILARLNALPVTLDATRIEVAPGANERGFYWVALVYAYENMTGDQFTDTVKRLIDKEKALDFQKQVISAIREAE